MWLLLLNPCIHELYQIFNEGLNVQTLGFDSKVVANPRCHHLRSLKETDSTLLSLELFPTVLTLDRVEGAGNQAGLLEKTLIECCSCHCWF